LCVHPYAIIVNFYRHGGKIFENWLDDISSENIEDITGEFYSLDESNAGEIVATARHDPQRHDKLKRDCAFSGYNPFDFLVPEVGIEPTLPQGKGDFESPASTSFTTPACWF
jgi:hypothetical protein